MRHMPLYTDLVFCIVLLPLMIIAFPVERWWATAPVYFCLFVVWLYTTYFLYSHYIVPGLFRNRQRRIAAIVCIAVSLAVTALFSTYEITSPYYHLRRQYARAEIMRIPVWGARPNQQAVWLHYIVVVTFCFAVGMVSEAYRQRLAREEMELERRKAELALYKVQANPHFLFNTLNTLYGLLITGSDKTVEMMEKFINLTKYIYLNARRDFIPLSEEVEYMEQYIDLQRLRVGTNADVRFTYHMENGQQEIPPMLLITFVENAFKYGISSFEPCFISIGLNQEQDGHLAFTAKNSVVQQDRKASTGMGIENCRRRLELLYPGRYTLTYGKEGNDVFAVYLTLGKEDAAC
ncbi:MAG: sensor histidine kinase [Prevotella sp.]